VSETITALAFVLAVGAAAYSTWSPCGQSMLSQLNPLAERTRGQRYAVTAIWFVIGALAGGATLGIAMVALALAVDAIGISAAAAAGIAAVCALIGAASDARLLSFAPPFHRRQVNEDWLPRYRGWFYGVGFGWQIGTGLATYIMTTAVFVMIAFGALSASPVVAFAVGITFAFLRGIVVFATARRTTFESLAALHRRFHALGPVVQRAVMLLQALVAVVAAYVAWEWWGVLAVGVAITAHAAGRVRITSRPPAAEEASRTSPPSAITS